MRLKNVLILAISLFYIGTTGIQAQTVKDIDGNVYHTVTIGTQVWMAENLKTTKFRDGVTIPLVSNKTWEEVRTPAYCWYNNDAAVNKNTFGALYNWYAVNTTKLCPTGWHVPTEDEWTILIHYLGGEDIAGGKLKEIGVSHWESPNEGATNSSSFSAVPKGHLLINGVAQSVSAGWWTAKEGGATYAWWRAMASFNSAMQRYTAGKYYLYSVRC